MRHWAFLLGGMLVWTAHFFLLYAAGSIFLTSLTARLLAEAVTAVCLAADGLILHRALAIRRGGAAARDRWTATMAALFAALSLVAVAWQGLPALLI